MQAALIERGIYQEQRSFRNEPLHRPSRPSEAFDLEHYKNPTDNELRRDIISYLGEYRLQIPRYDYELTLSRGYKEGGEIAIRDIDRGEDLKIKAQRAIDQRRLRGEPVHREQAEYKGLENLQKQINSSKTGDTILWASPPGPTDQGYGNYGFLYVGKVTRLPCEEAHLAMSAVRLEKATLSQYNLALSELTGSNLSYLNAESFLANPATVVKLLTGIRSPATSNWTDNFSIGYGCLNIRRFAHRAFFTL